MSISELVFKNTFWNYFFCITKIIILFLYMV